MPRDIYHRGGLGTKRALSYRNDFNISGCANLPSNITINGVTKTPTYRYDACNADTTKWAATVGEDIPIAGSGDDPVIDDYSPGICDSRVKFNEGKYFQADSATFATIGSDDFVIEGVAFISASSTAIMSRLVSASDRVEVYGNTTSGGLYFYFGNTTVTVSVANGNWHHFIIFGDRSGSVAVYVNGTGVSSTVISSVTDVGDSAKLTFGARPNGTSKTPMSAACLTMWQGAGWLDTHLQADVAEERFYRACGIWPQLAKGASVPTLATRSTAAYLDKYSSTGKKLLVPVGVNWLQVCSRKDSNGETLNGYLAEPTGTNLILTSNGGTGWAKVNAGDTVTTDDGIAPDKDNTCFSLVADATDTEHGYDHGSVTLTAAPYTLSCWAKPGDVNLVKLECTTIANAHAYFNLSTGTVGTTGAAAVARISEEYDSGHYRCEITFTGTAADHTMRLLAIETDNDDTFTGDGSTISVNFWGVQCEQGSKASSLINTTGSAATRTANVLRFEAGDNIGGQSIGQGTISTKLLVPDFTSSGDLALFALTDGGSSSDRILSYVPSASQALTIIGTAGGAVQFGMISSVDISDNTIHLYEFKYKPNYFEHKIDGATQGTIDTAGSMPDEIDRLDIGQGQAASGQIRGLISEFKCYKKVI